MIKVICFFILLFSFNSFSCEVSLDVLFKNPNSDLDLIIENTKHLLSQKKIQISSNPTQNIQLKLFERFDYHENKYYAASSLTVRSTINGQMLYYVHGIGNYSQSKIEAMKLENLILAIKNAVFHLPECK